MPTASTHWLVFFLLVPITIGVSVWLPENFPNPRTDAVACKKDQRGWVCDPDALLTPAALKESEEVIQAIVDDKLCVCGRQLVGFQVAVAILDRMDTAALGSKLRGWSPWSPGITEVAKYFAAKIVDSWGADTDDCDNGIVLLVSIQDRVSYLHTEGMARLAMPDEVAQMIIDRMNARFKVGERGEAIVKALHLIRDALDRHGITSVPHSPVNPTRTSTWRFLPNALLELPEFVQCIFIAIAVIAVAAAKGGTGYKAQKHRLGTTPARYRISNRHHGGGGGIKSGGAGGSW